MESTLIKKEELTDKLRKLEDDKIILKRYLSQYYICKKKKSLLERRLKEVNIELKQPIGGVGYSQVPRSQTNAVSLGSASIIFRIAEIEERIANQKDIVSMAMLKTMDIMDFLPETSTERMILELRHIDCVSWEQVVKDTSLTRTPCNNYYNKGIDKLMEYKKVRRIIDTYKKTLEDDE